ncbi:MAG: hypothetical protein HC904_01990 [Blastochloris sp.]|nr:hypothetical protein [Blastochloris sp.]
MQFQHFTSYFFILLAAASDIDNWSATNICHLVEMSVFGVGLARATFGDNYFCLEYPKTGSRIHKPSKKRYPKVGGIQVGNRISITTENELSFSKLMYFLRYQPLKDKLRSRTLSDLEALPYLLIFVGLAASYVLFPKTEEYENWDWIGGILSVTLAVGGVCYAYV